jgi:hypothetical protein
MTKRYQRGNQEGIDQSHCIVSSSLIYAFLITPLISLGHCIVSPALIYAFLITLLISFGHCIVSPSLITMAKRYQRSNQEGIDQRRTDNTMTKRYQRSNQEGIDQRRTDNTMTPS